MCNPEIHRYGKRTRIYDTKAIRYLGRVAAILNAQLSEARTYSRTTPGDTTTKIRLEGVYSFQPFLLFGNVKSYLAVICFNDGTPVVTNWGTDKFQVEAVSTTSCNIVIPSYNRITIISSASFSYYSLV